MKSHSFLVLGLVLWTVSGQRRPPNYAQNQMPTTSFSCRDKIIGGYYADPETDCQMFHVCVKIPGRGIQDFRFLCPNDTSFDQENQICDDWYNIDCEAATLYYSDNFDLYRIGGEHGKLGAKLPSVTVNNAVSEIDDNYNYLQKSDRGESVPGDLLRGSHSGNFFSNKNRGREYDDDVKDVHSKDKNKDKQAPEKTAFFKENNFGRSQNRNSNFNRNQYKVASSTTVQPSTAEVTTVRGRGQNFAQRNDFYRRQQPTETTVQNIYNPTTIRPSFESARNHHQSKNPQTALTNAPQYNQNAYTTPQQKQLNQNSYTPLQQKQYNNPTTVQQKHYTQSPQTSVPIQNQYNQNSYSTPAQNQFNQNAFPNQPQKQLNQNSYTTPAHKQFNQNTYTTPAQKQFNYNTFTAAPQQKANNQNAYTTPAQQKPFNQNYNPVSQSATITVPQQNQYQNNQSPQKQVNQNTFSTPAQNQFNNQQFTTPSHRQYNQNSYSTQNQFSQSAHTTQNFQTFPPTTQKPFARNTYQAQQTFPTTFAPQTFPHVSSPAYQQYSQNYDVPKTHVSTTIKPYVDAQTYRGTFETTARPNVNSNYETQRLYKINTGSATVDDSKDEFLKTAHSQNLGASRLNRVHSAYKGFNATVAASYNFIPSEDPTTLKPRYTPSTTIATTPVTPTTKEDYDYAYYDNGSPSEYDNLELDFRRTTPRKNT